MRNVYLFLLSFITSLTVGAQTPSRLFLWQSQNQDWQKTIELTPQGEGIFTADNVQFLATTEGINTCFIFTEYTGDDKELMWANKWGGSVAEVNENTWYLTCQSSTCQKGGYSYQMVDPGKKYNVCVDTKNTKVILTPSGTMYVRTANDQDWFAVKAMTEQSEGVYKVNGIPLCSHFCFDTDAADGWTSNPWGPNNASEGLNNDGTSKSFGLGSYFSTTPGIYDVTLDFSQRKVTIEKRDLYLITNHPWNSKFKMLQNGTRMEIDNIFMWSQFYFRTSEHDSDTDSVRYGPLAIDHDNNKDINVDSELHIAPIVEDRNYEIHNSPYNEGHGYYKVIVDFALNPTKKTPTVKIEPATSEPELKYATYNIRLLNSGDGVNNWANRKAAAINFMRTCGAGIICLQEVTSSQWNDIRAGMGSGYTLIGRGRDTDVTSEGTPILFDNTKWIFANGTESNSSGTFWLSDTPDVRSKVSGADTYRIATWANLTNKENGLHVFVVSTHLTHRCTNENAIRQQQIEKLKSHVKELNTMGHPVIIMGDFNMVDDSEEYPYMIYKGELGEMWDTYRTAQARTGGKNTFHNFSSTFEDKRDYIFVTPNICAVESHVVDPKNGGSVYLSDHCPMVATLIPFSKNTLPGTFWAVSKRLENSWNLLDQDSPITYVGDGIYKGQNIALSRSYNASPATHCRFTITATPSSNWTAVNKQRYGATNHSSGDDKISPTTFSANFSKNEDAVYDIPEGFYDITIDINTHTISFTYPDAVYAVGRVNNNGWTPQTAVQSTYHEEGDSKYYFAFLPQKVTDSMFGITPRRGDGEYWKNNRFGNATRTYLDGNGRSVLLRDPLSASNEEYSITLRNQDMHYGYVELGGTEGMYFQRTDYPQALFLVRNDAGTWTDNDGAIVATLGNDKTYRFEDVELPTNGHGVAQFYFATNTGGSSNWAWDKWHGNTGGEVFVKSRTSTAIYNQAGNGFYTTSPDTYNIVVDPVNHKLTITTVSETGIQAVFEATDYRLQTTEEKIYNLSGQRVSKTQKGVNIINGKKLLVK